MQLTQEIKPAYHAHTTYFVRRGFRESGPDFFGKIILSVGVYFYLDGYLNKQNFSICGSEKRKLSLNFRKTSVSEKSDSLFWFFTVFYSVFYEYYASVTVMSPMIVSDNIS